MSGRPAARFAGIGAALAVALTLGAASLSTPAQWLAGLSTDVLFWLRYGTSSPSAPPPPVAIVAIDEATYRHPDYRDTPRVLWTERIAAVLDRLLASGAAVVVFDAIFPTSLEDRLPGVDRPFLRTLRRGAREGRILLASAQHGTLPILPHAGQAIAVGGAANIRSANLETEPDGIVRRVPVVFRRADGGIETSLAVEAALRASDGALVLKDDRLLWAGAPLETHRGALTVDFFADQRAIPTFSLADLDGCGDDGFFSRAFAGKVVFIGLVLDVEDRRSTSMRFYAAPDASAYAAPCTGTVSTDGAAVVARESIPGVYVHAFATAGLLGGSALGAVGVVGVALLVFIAAGMAAFVTLRLPATAAAAALAVAAVGWAALCVAMLQGRGMVLPLLEPPLACAVAFGAMSAWRFGVTDRDRRRLRRMFGYYLAPSVVDRMAESGRLPALGGETRTVTIFFSDLAGFTALSEKLRDEELVALLNRYLTAMTDAIEARGGFVDKYVGDAIVAVFGAPHDDAEHARQAVRAAMDCEARLAALNEAMRREGRSMLRQRIGLNTGPALVGNIGSARRFNYTVIGDTVNLAARLEGANKVYGTTLLAAGATAAAWGGDPVLVRIDRVAVVGRTQPVDLFAVLPQGTDGAAVGEAVDRYLAGEFEDACGRFQALASVFPAAAALAERCRALSADPPSGWTGVHVLTDK